MIKEGESTVDTFTAPWGAFTEARNLPAALEFVRFMATDAQELRVTVSPDPPADGSALSALSAAPAKATKEQR